MSAVRRLTLVATTLALVVSVIVPGVDAGKTKDDRVPNSFLVGLRDDVDPARFAAKIASQYGGKASFVYDRMGGFAFAGSQAQADRLARDQRIKFLEPDRKVELVTHGPAGGVGHLNRLDAYKAFDKGYTGAGVSIAIVDTGVDRTHPVFHNSQVLNGKSCVRGNESDRNGHGTASASNAAGRYGVAHDANIVPVRVFPGRSSSTSVGKIVCGLNWIRKRNNTTPGSIDVVNMSLALGGSRTLKRAVRKLQGQGVIVVAAAGNNGGRIQAPASFRGVFGVSALGAGDRMARFSNHGANFTAPGVSIESARQGGGISNRSGTSRSAPMVAGVAAIVLAIDPAAAVKNVLQTSGRCPNNNLNTDGGNCGGRWRGDDRTAEPLVNAYCAGILADPTPGPVPVGGEDVAFCGF